jgi:ribosomal-protein-alanine N-acetyltransferase
MSVTLRPMQWPDIEVVAAIEAELFLDDPWTPEMFWAELAAVPESREVMVAVDGDEIVGYASLRFVATESDVNTIAVRADRHGQGIGRLLMTWIEDAARALGSLEMFLEVRSDNSVAVSMYDADGYERIDVRPNYYGTDVDAIVMRKKLSA